MLSVVNFGVIVLKARDPFVEWNNSVEEGGRKFSREKVNENPSAYIVPELDGPKELEQYLKGNCERLFRNELNNWWRNEDDWPEGLSFEKFKEWFEVEYSSVVFDGFPGPGPTVIRRD